MIKAKKNLFWFIVCFIFMPLNSYEINGSAEANSLKRAKVKAKNNFHSNIRTYLKKQINDALGDDYLSEEWSLSSRFWKEIDDNAEKINTNFSLFQVTISLGKSNIDKIFLAELFQMDYDENNLLQSQILHRLKETFSHKIENYKKSTDFDNSLQFIYPKKTFSHPEIIVLFQEEKLNDISMNWEKEGKFYIPKLGKNIFSTNLITIIYENILERKLQKIKIAIFDLENFISIKSNLGDEIKLAELLGFKVAETAPYSLEIKEHIKSGTNTFGNNFAIGKAELVITKSGVEYLTFLTKEIKKISKSSQKELVSNIKSELRKNLNNEIREYVDKCLGKKN